MTLEKLSVLGCDNQPFPNSFIRQGFETNHLAIFFPGFAYGHQLPALHYPARLLADYGADVLRLERLYATTAGFSELPENERIRTIIGDALSACKAGLAQRSYQRITLVGKSLGTMAIARLLKLEPELHNAHCIWLTPLIKHDKTREAIIEKRPRSLFVIGTADDHYDPEILSQLEEATEGTSLIIQGANHGLEIPGNVQKSIKGMEELVLNITQFLHGIEP